jgi:malto-oligosyltrehalose trehalohydrolase
MLKTYTARSRHHHLPYGAEIAGDQVRFRFWAPNHATVALRIEGETQLQPMTPVGLGFHELLVPSAGPGTLYRYVLTDGLEVPDPASRFQPDDVHGPSEVIDPKAYRWKDSDWHGRPLTELVIYELHVGTFTPEGTFQAVIGRLNYLRTLGVTAIELMPIADFPGGRNWGYDGVLLFAPDSTYGRPEDLKALVDAAHRCGISVLLDVVYNHFGPDGNYLPAFAPIFTDKHKTSWGPAVNYDAEGSQTVRDLVVNNAVYWILEFNLDGLRLDAVHAIKDDSPEHVLAAIARGVRQAAAQREVHLILENEENQASWLTRAPDGSAVQFSAQWNDDIHHVLHAAATGETSGYYADYTRDTPMLGRALAEGFAFQGELMPYRGHPRGEPAGFLPPTAFISFIQNHDQVGNRAFGDRLTAFAPPEAVRAIAAVYLLAPQIPMIFMGEEWGASEPFPFFCDFEEELAGAVREGRRAEFARFPEFQDPAKRDQIPDPTASDTFTCAKLDWAARLRAPHTEWLALYRKLLALRHVEIVPRLKGVGGHSATFETLGDCAVRVRWTLGDGSRLTLVANLSPKTPLHVGDVEGKQIFSVGDFTNGTLGAWAVVWSLQYG